MELFSLKYKFNLSHNLNLQTLLLLLKICHNSSFFSNAVLLHSVFIALFGEDSVVTLFAPSLMHLSRFSASQEER